MLRLNVANDKSSARLVMRVEGILKLVLNVALWPQIKIEKVGDKAARFVATHLENTKELCSYLVRVAKSEIINELIVVVDANKNLGKDSPSSSSTKNGTPEKKKEEKTTEIPSRETKIESKETKEEK